MDYRLLLWKYIQYIIDCEGISFIRNRLDDENRGAWGEKTFTVEEVRELLKLDLLSSYVPPQPDSVVKQPDNQDGEGD